MANLADLNIKRCRRCGKLFKQTPESAYCQRCTEARKQGVRPAPPRPVYRIPEAPETIPVALPAQKSPAEPVAEDPEPEAPCVRCQQHPAIEGSEFCLDCSFALYRSLGAAAENLFTTLERMESQRTGSSLNVISAYEAKRRRTATSRIDPAGARRIK